MYRQQFQTVATASRWTDEQCLTALTVELRERHLEYVFRTQLHDRIQRPGEGLQQWALKIE